MLVFPYAPVIDALRAFLSPQPIDAVAARLEMLEPLSHKSELSERALAVIKR